MRNLVQVSEDPDPNRLGVGVGVGVADRGYAASIPNNRKISVSFVSEVGPTCNSIDPTQAFGFTPDPSLKYLQQRILRLQVAQVVLGLMLMVLSGVALIEERGLFGIGFGLVSAILGIISAAFGIQQCDLKMTSIFNLLAFFGLLPTFFFCIESLVENSRFFLNQHQHQHHLHHNVSEHHNHNNGHHNNGHNNHHLVNEYHHHLQDVSSVTTIWTLSWLELFHLLPLAASILYLLFLYRHLSYYTHY